MSPDATDDQRVLARLHRIPQDLAHVIQGADYEAKAEYARRMAEFLRSEDSLASEAEFFRSRSLDFEKWKAAENER